VLGSFKQSGLIWTRDPNLKKYTAKGGARQRGLYAKQSRSIGAATGEGGEEAIAPNAILAISQFAQIRRVFFMGGGSDVISLLQALTI